MTEKNVGALLILEPQFIDSVKRPEKGEALALAVIAKGRTLLEIPWPEGVTFDEALTAAWDMLGPLRQA